VRKCRCHPSIVSHRTAVSAAAPMDLILGCMAGVNQKQALSGGLLPEIFCYEVRCIVENHCQLLAKLVLQWSEKILRDGRCEAIWRETHKCRPLQRVTVEVFQYVSEK